MHYIRCVKPNPQSVAKAFEDSLVTDQLRCAGMIEAVRISRAAYPNRLRHEYFMQRFGPLAPKSGGLEAMLQQRGCPVVACDAIKFDDDKRPGSEYWEERIYCKEVRRIHTTELMRLSRPERSALIFSCCYYTPWEAYLTRYPEVPLVVIICGGVSHYATGDQNKNKVVGPSQYLKLAERGGA